MNQSYIDFIKFFKRHNLYNEEIFNYLKNNSTLIDYLDTDARSSIGYHVFNQNNRLQSINLCVPFINNQITILINIHEYLHGLILYQYLGKKYQIGPDTETLPILYESIYISENPTQQLQDYLNNINKAILRNDCPLQYKIAVAIQPELLDYYQKEKPSFKKLQAKSKKLVKKHQKK